MSEQTVHALGFALAVGVLCLAPLRAENLSCAERVDCDPPPPLSVADTSGQDSGAATDRFDDLAQRHQLRGTACYYSNKFEGRKTANGEIFRQDRRTAAHRTLPFGTVVEVQSVATGKKIRVRINDRGPFSGGFVIDLSRSAAQYLGVDKAGNRRVRMRVVELPEDSRQKQETEAAASESID